MLRVECPECGEPVELSENTQPGDRVICAECGIELEVLSLSPLEVDYVLEEDWDDDWEEDDLEEDDLYEDDEWDDE